MHKSLLFATKNPSKFALMVALVRPLNIHLLSLSEYPEFVPNPESGSSIDANARIKAKQAYAHTGKVCFAIDTSLTIMGLENERQPGAYVRRRSNDSTERKDQEMMRYYQTLFSSLGRESKGEWRSAIAFADSTGKTSTAAYSNTTLFLSKASPIQIPGEPLNSFQFDRNLDKYLSEMSVEERIIFMGNRAEGFQSFLKELMS